MRCFVTPMVKTCFAVLLLPLILPLWAGAAGGKYSYLEPFEVRPQPWTAELAEPPPREPQRVDVDLSDFFREFARDGLVKIYAGYGYEAYFRGKAASLLEILKKISAETGLPVENWALSDDGTGISFRDSARGLEFSVRVGSERNEFMRAFSENEIIMYGGHSRYGRGLTFDSFTNYVRMGGPFDAIEVDARNPYFGAEPMLLQDWFPPLRILLDGAGLEYQYRGQREETAYLSRDSYTKNIPGRDADLRQLQFLPGRQILYLHSCQNEGYWRQALRRVLPDPRRKFIFGTWRKSWGGLRPDAVLIMSVVQGVSESARIVHELNATRDCDDCFTSY